MAAPGCASCGDRGWAPVADGWAIDACRDCASRAEAVWRFNQEGQMWNEHVNAAGRGSDPSAVTMEARGRRVILTVGRAVLERMPWYRGGADVTVLLGGGSEAGRMRVVRGDTHRLLTVRQRLGLEKLPPVSLAMDLLPGMPAGAEHAAEAVGHRITPGLLEVTLPGWAGPPVPAVAPPTPFQHATFMPIESVVAIGRSA